MIRRLLALGLLLASCSPVPRDAAWFEANPVAARKVVASCEAGARDAECENARTGLSRLKAKARKDRYRQGFE